MISVSHDETIISLRRVCDRYAGQITAGQALPHELISEIFANLPRGVFERVALPADGTNNHPLTVRVDPLFYTYMAATAEYCLSLIHGRVSPKDDPTVPAKAVAD